MSTRSYDTDLNDAAWAWIAPYLPAARPGGRPRTTDLRAVLNAIFYLLRTGCQWRLLPREFPRPGTVYHYFRAWKEGGVLAELQQALHKQARLTGQGPMTLDNDTFFQETQVFAGRNAFHFGPIFPFVSVCWMKQSFVQCGFVAQQ